MAWWRASTRPRPPLAISLLVAAACGDATRHETPPVASSPVASPGAPSVAPVASGLAAPSRVDGGAPTGERPLGDDGLVPIDLAPAGEGWSGVTARAPAGATVSGDGGGSALVFLGPGQPVVLSTSSGAIADHRLGAIAAARVVEGTITFSTDTPQEIAYEQRGADRDGQPLRTWGFAATVQLGRAKVACARATARDERELAAARAVCSSLTRR